MTRPHTRSHSITVSQAVPIEDSDKSMVLDKEQPDNAMKKKKDSEAPSHIAKAQQYFHFAYTLLPDYDEPTGADVVTFPSAAKVYSRGGENPTVKTWRDRDNAWFSFQHNHKITVTKSLLEKLFYHCLEMRVWNTKDKVAAQTRFDRPKAFKLPIAKPGEDPEDVGGVRPLVMLQSRNFMSLQPKRYFQNREEEYYSNREDIYRLLPHERLEMDIRFAELAETNPELLPKRPEAYQEKPAATQTKRKVSAEWSEDGSRIGSANIGKIPHTIVGIPKHEVFSDENARTYSRLGRLAAASDRADKPVNLAPPAGKSNSIKSDARRLSTDSRRDPEGGGSKTTAPPRAVDRERDAREAKEAYYREHGICQVELRMAMLFAGLSSITNRVAAPADGIKDLFVTISVDCNLMSDEQKKQLNPLTIKVDSTTKMPDQPNSYAELRQKCQPVYCRYKFGLLPWYQTPSKLQEQDISWNDTNVVLLGTMAESELRECLSGPRFQVHVHDRDRKYERPERPPALFGADSEDANISNVGVVANRRTSHSAFAEGGQGQDPYGTAEFDLLELLLGQKKLYLKAPVQLGPLPDPLVHAETVGNSPMPPAKFIDCGTMMKISVEIAYPLKNIGLTTTPLPQTDQCPYSRIVYICDVNNKELTEAIINKCWDINCRTLGLSSLPPSGGMRKAALQTYNFTDEQKSNPLLDIITGFQLVDQVMHLFALEGIRDGAILEMWESLPHPNKALVENYEVLYDSDLMFKDRLYAKFGPSLQRVRLHEPLEAIVRQPLLYVRDMIPRLCFAALSKVNQVPSFNKGKLKK